MLAQADLTAVDPWAFKAHPQVWLLVGGLIAAYVYAMRVVGPRAVEPGQTVTTVRQRWAFVGAIALLWFGSDWPMHDISEEYLYSAHMLQHMVFSYFMPPLVLLATPEWFLRAVVGRARGYAVVRFLTKPVVAGVVFNAAVMITHIPGLVNRSAENSPLHYSLHVLLVVTSLLMWMPVVGPFRELRMGPPGTMIYLFLQSVVPTVPAGWLTFAEGVVYKHYDTPIRVFDWSPTNDQQIAGAIMKIGGSVFLWTIVVFVFFGRFARRFNDEQSYRRDRQMPRSEITGNDDDALTFDRVAEAFERTTPPPEPSASAR